MPREEGKWVQQGTCIVIMRLSSEVCFLASNVAQQMVTWNLFQVHVQRVLLPASLEYSAFPYAGDPSGLAGRISPEYRENLST